MAEGVARLPLRGSRSVCTCQHHVPWNMVLTSASIYSTFFYLTALQYTQIIIEYSVIVGRSLVWLKTSLNPTMTILLFSSILSTKRQWQSSTSMRPLWQRQKSVMSRIQSTDHEKAIFDRQRENIKMVYWPDCGIVQIVTARKPSTALQSPCPAILHSKDKGRTPGKNYRDELLSYHPTQLR